MQPSTLPSDASSLISAFYYHYSLVNDIALSERINSRPLHPFFSASNLTEGMNLDLDKEVDQMQCILERLRKLHNDHPALGKMENEIKSIEKHQRTRVQKREGSRPQLRYMSMSEIIHSINMHIAYNLRFCNDELTKIYERRGNVDISYFERILDYISDEMYQVRENIIRYQITFNPSVDDGCMVGGLDTCIDHMEKVLDAFDYYKLTWPILEKIIDILDYVRIIWEERFIEDFECWLCPLSEDKLHLCKDAVIIVEDNLPEINNDNTKKAFLLMMKYAMYAEKLFYSFVKNKNHTAVELRNAMLNNRKTKGKTSIINAHNVSGRAMIASSAGAVEQSLSSVDSRQLTSCEEIQKLLQWHRKGAKNWNRETVHRGMITPPKAAVKPISINYQFHPVPGQLGNIFVNGVGQYGEEKDNDILKVINQFTGGVPDKERLLAQQMLAYKYGDGSALTIEALRAKGFTLSPRFSDNKKMIERLNRAAFLICFHEVSRRKHQGYYLKGKEAVFVPELPFGIAVACALRLISDGYLNMKAVFAQDALYGVFTGKSIMKDNFLKTIQKFNALFSYFTQKYMHKIDSLYQHNKYLNNSFDNEKINVVFTPEYFHQVLLSADGGSDDSDGEDYPDIFPDEYIDLEEAINTIGPEQLSHFHFANQSSSSSSSGPFSYSSGSSSSSSSSSSSYSSGSSSSTPWDQN